jgi:allantoin racemase
VARELCSAATAHDEIILAGKRFIFNRVELCMILGVLLCSSVSTAFLDDRSAGARYNTGAALRRTLTLILGQSTRILLVNGNTSQIVTDRLASLARQFAPQVTFLPVTPAFGPPYVSTAADVAVSAHAVIASIASSMDAFGGAPDGCIIACFGEPGLAAARQQFNFPVVGMAEAAIATALQHNGTFGIVTLGDFWPSMLRDLVRHYGVADRFAGVVRVPGTPLDLLANPEAASKAVAEAASALAEQTGADTIIVGGAALTGLRLAIDSRPRVIDCLAAAIAQVMALTGYKRMIANLS